MDVTEDERPQPPTDTVIAFRGDHTIPANIAIPETLLDIQRVWRDNANAYGDEGSCVLGAEFYFTYLDRNYFMPPISMWQGSISWEHCVGAISEILKEVGATNIRYEWGNMD